MEELRVDAVLTGWGKAVPVLASGASEKDDFLVLVLDPNAKKVRIVRYNRTQSAMAETACLRAEEAAVGTACQVVLVSVGKLSALPRAFPNYYLDTTAFVGLVRTVIS